MSDVMGARVSSGGGGCVEDRGSRERLRLLRLPFGRNGAMCRRNVSGETEMPSAFSASESFR